MALGRKTGGRQAGTPNKATSDVRQAIAQFAQNNSHRLAEWLDQVAQGIKVTDPETGEVSYLVTPNPAKAIDLYQSVLEYYIPKQARVELAGDQDNPLQVQTQVDLFGQFVQNLRQQRQLEKPE